MSAQDLLQRGLAAFERGALEEAVSNWSEAARLYRHQYLTSSRERPADKVRAIGARRAR